MKKIICLLSLFCFSVFPCFASVVVPEGTEVVLHLKKQKSQRTMTDSREYSLRANVMNDVYINKQKIFSTGDKAKINIKKNNKAKFFGKGGTLILDGGYIIGKDNKKYFLNLHEEYTGKNTCWLAKILIFKKGQNVVLSPSSKIIAKTATEYKI